MKVLAHFTKHHFLTPIPWCVHLISVDFLSFYKHSALRVLVSNSFTRCSLPCPTVYQYSIRSTALPRKWNLEFTVVQDRDLELSMMATPRNTISFGYSSATSNLSRTFGFSKRNQDPESTAAMYRSFLLVCVICACMISDPASIWNSRLMGLSSLSCAEQKRLPTSVITHFGSSSWSYKDPPPLTLPTLSFSHT